MQVGVGVKSYTSIELLPDLPCLQVDSAIKCLPFTVNFLIVGNGRVNKCLREGGIC